MAEGAGDGERNSHLFGTHRRSVRGGEGVHPFGSLESSSRDFLKKKKMYI